MSKELGITKGECKVNSDYPEEVLINGWSIDFTCNGASLDEDYSHAKLFCEAHKVANETNKTPRQLLEERNEALDMLIELLPYIAMAELDKAYTKGLINKVVKRLSNLIKKLES